MTISIKHFSVGASLLAIALFISAPLKADPLQTEISVHIGAGHYRTHGKAYGGHGLRRNKRHYRRHPGYRAHRDRSPGFGHRYFRSPRGCHPVSRFVYDRHGELIKIGGIMYYDLYGRGYVVPRSHRAYRR